MTTPELKKIYGILKNAYKVLDEQAQKEGIDFTSPEYDNLKSQLRTNVLAKWGFSLEEYQTADQEYRDSRNTPVMADVMNTGTLAVLQNTQNDIAELKKVHVHSADEIKQMAHEVAKEYIKPPQITNQIVREVTIEKPQIIKETTVEKVIEEKPYDMKPIMQSIAGISTRIDNIKIPDSPDLVAFKESLITEWQTSLKKNIDIFGMPDFRKLAMGLRGDIDSLSSRISSSSGAFPQMTTAQRLALSAVDGQTAYDTTIGAPYIYFGGNWYALQLAS